MVGVAPLCSLRPSSAWSLGAEEMRLEVFAQNARALALYTAMGFKNPCTGSMATELELAQDAIAGLPHPYPQPPRRQHRAAMAADRPASLRTKPSR